MFLVLHVRVCLCERSLLPLCECLFLPVLRVLGFVLLVLRLRFRGFLFLLAVLEPPRLALQLRTRTWGFFEESGEFLGNFRGSSRLGNLSGNFLPAYISIYRSNFLLSSLMFICGKNPRWGIFPRSSRLGRSVRFFFPSSGSLLLGFDRLKLVLSASRSFWCQRLSLRFGELLSAFWCVP